MGQANRRGTPDEGRELAIAWEEAHREDRRRFPPPQLPRSHPSKDWTAVAALLAIAAQSRGPHTIKR